MNEERDSQLSAMFDGELPAAECELLARRITRDGALHGAWARYAVIGATIRKDSGVQLDLRVAERVRHLIHSEGALGSETTVVPSPHRGAGGSRWLKPLTGIAIAASVAAVSVLMLRERQLPAATSIVAATPGAIGDRAVERGEPESYVVPTTPERVSLVAPAQLANYVVAHSEFSMPLTRRNMLTALVASEAEAEPPQSDLQVSDLQGSDRPQDAAPAVTAAPDAER